MTLEPSGYDIMVMQMKETPKKGETVLVTLKFEKAGEVTVDFRVGPIGSKTLGGEDGTAMDHGSMAHGEMRKSQ